MSGIKGPITKNVIFFFLIINLLATGGLFVRSFYQPNAVTTLSVEEKLPDNLQKHEAKKDLFDRFRDAFNSNSCNEILLMLDPSVRGLFSPGYASESFKQMRSIIGDIKKGVYSNYYMAGQSQEFRIYELYYQFAAVSGKGTINITVAQPNEGHYKVIGFNMSISEGKCLEYPSECRQPTYGNSAYHDL